MNILVPLNDNLFLQDIVDAGADEFYFGFYDNDWEQRFGHWADLNRMSGFGRKANRYSFKQALQLVRQIKDYGKKVYLTLNANVYSTSEREALEHDYFPLIHESGVDGVIVSGPLEAEAAIKAGIAPVASTMCNIYNEDIADFYYRIGVRRMILPRDLTLNEIQDITKKHTDIEYEVFFMRNGCSFSDGYCLGTHESNVGASCGFLKRCRKNFDYERRDFLFCQDAELTMRLFRNEFHKSACGMCALYRLKYLGIHSLKIVGRADSPESVISDIRTTRKNLELIDICNNEEDYLEKMIFPYKNYSGCENGYSCYYPEIRF